MKKIAVLTSGGDAPGMNAAIRSVVRTAIYHGVKIYGVKRGYCGLIEDDLSEMNLGSVSDIIHRGGTILGTARCKEFYDEAGRRQAYETMRKHRIEGLIAIGGDGTFAGALKFDALGIPVIAVPGTIDNDIALTDRTIGFDTAVDTILDAINKIRDTATSHGRIFVIEVMGRHSGVLALTAGLAGGAESILIPEMPLDIGQVVANIKRGLSRGKKHSIILIAEGVGGSQEITKQIEQMTQLETRLTILGYLQRGGTPTGEDRNLASRMGAVAVEMLLAGERAKMTASAGDIINGIPIAEALAQKKEINYEDYQLAGILSR